MSFVINVMENDTLKYWKNKLKWKWYQVPFLMSKNIEIEAFMSEYSKPNVFHFDGPNRFNITKKINNIEQNSTIAIVVPIYVASEKSKKQVERLIKSIKSQKRVADFVFLIDDCSPIEYDSFGYDIYRLDENGGPAKARNYGIKLSKKANVDVIAFTDSDVILDCNWIKEIINAFCNNKYMQAISGKTISYGNTWFDKYHNINGTLNGRKFIDSNQLLYGPTCNFSVELKSLGNITFSKDFPLAAGEDIEFCFRFLKNGNNIGFEANVRIYHDFGYRFFSFNGNKKQFINLFRKYARGEKTLLKKVPEYYYYLNETLEISNISLN